MFKAYITIKILDKRLMPGEAEEVLKGLAEYSTAGLYIINGTALRVTTQDAYTIVLEAYSESLIGLLRAVKAVEEAFKAMYSAYVEATLQ